MILAPFSRPFSMMAKPVGARCNLACTYCYYLEKSNLNKGGSVMDDKLLETFIQQYIEAQTVPFVQFTWHGGEPLMRNIRFFKLALELQKRIRKADVLRQVSRPTARCSPTNGVDFSLKIASSWAFPSTDRVSITTLSAIRDAAPRPSTT